MWMYQVDVSSLKPSERDALEQRLTAGCWEVFPDYYRNLFKIVVNQWIDPRKEFSIPDSCPINRL